MRKFSLGRVFGFGLILLILAMLAIACAQPAPQQSQSQPPAPTSVQQPVFPTQQQNQPGNQPGYTPNVVRPPSEIQANHSANIEYLDLVPMTMLVRGVKKAPVSTPNGKVKIPLITWGGDEHAILANGGRTTQPGSIFAREGLQVELFREDNFVRQVERFVAGETPYLRGTKDMIATAHEALLEHGIEVVEIYNHSRSTGGDTMVCRNSMVKNPSDLRGQYIGLQIPGPHPYFLARYLNDNNLTINDVKIRGLRELTIPPYDTRGVAVDPASAMQRDPTLACVMVIVPDMLALTSGGNVGTGAEGSVEGAYMVVSSKEADVIYDVYVVRRDYLETNRDDVQKFVHGLMVAAEEQIDLFNRKDIRQAEYQGFVRLAAEILRDNEQLTADIEDMYADMTLQKYGGNVQFYSGEAARNFEALTREAEEAMMGYGLRSKHVPLDHARWDYAVLAQGIRDTAGVKVPKFDPVKAQQYVEQPSVQASSGFVEHPVYFEAGEVDFTLEENLQKIDTVIEKAPVYPGAIINVVAYVDPGFYNTMKDRGASEVELKQIRIASVNTAKKRADSIQNAILARAEEKNVDINVTQFVPSGRGFDGVPHSDTRIPIKLDPISGSFIYDEANDTPEMKQKRAENRKVVFKFIPAVAEIIEGF